MPKTITVIGIASFALLTALACSRDCFALGWLCSAITLSCIAAGIGLGARLGALGLLLDTRGRYSLSQLQLILWTIIVISLLVSVAVLRWFGDENALDFVIPTPLLGVMGISVGTAVISGAVKTAKDSDHADRVASSTFMALEARHRPRWPQMFLVEEGAAADSSLDVMKFQAFVLTFVIAGAYIATVVSQLEPAEASLDSLPSFSDTMLILLAASHGGYVAGKLPTPEGNPPTDVATVANRAARGPS